MEAQAWTSITIIEDEKRLIVPGSAFKADITCLHSGNLGFDLGTSHLNIPYV